jgi:hypothetical protein
MNIKMAKAQYRRGIAFMPPFTRPFTKRLRGKSDFRKKSNKPFV